MQTDVVVLYAAVPRQGGNGSSILGPCGIFGVRRDAIDSHVARRLYCRRRTISWREDGYEGLATVSLGSINTMINMSPRESMENITNCSCRTRSFHPIFEASGLQILSRNASTHLISQRDPVQPGAAATSGTRPRRRRCSSLRQKRAPG